ncbi:MULTISPECIES: precorrin-6y C5,15-methyltransferase (decarboxylating) subunit CbiE [unclassified Corynebacterium]|uniref:precorrin-6y C5,15-methyltransferase (decarboxylating) subunit CbiE n=1 Tax=unclassified Corynebacterium TaxID=2624378 RepID=UPI0030AB943E
MTDPGFTSTIPVVGIGCDGWQGLSPHAQAALTSAKRIHGSPRQLSLLDDVPEISAQLLPWPEKFWANWDDVLAPFVPGEDCVVASGDPMFHGIGTSLVRELGAHAITVIPAPSSVSLACARLGWALNSTPLISLVTAPAGLAGAAEVVPVADSGQRFLVLCRNAASVADIARVLGDRPDTTLTALTNLGGLPGTDLAEVIVTGTVADPPVPAGDLTVLAVEPRGARRGWLRDTDFDTDGQLTKSPIRELSVTALNPQPGALLWDIGGGTGSISIEWARHGGRAITFERSQERATRIQGNVDKLSGRVQVICGSAPEVLSASDLGPAPDAIFIGGGLTADGMIDACVAALAPGGTLVANTVTIESEAVLWASQRRFGGTVTRLSVERAGEVGKFTAWRPALPVVQWVLTKPS